VGVDARFPAGVDDRDRGGEGEKRRASRRRVGPDHEREPDAAAGRDPLAVEPSPATGLLVGDDRDPVGSVPASSRARSLVDESRS